MKRGNMTRRTALAGLGAGAALASGAVSAEPQSTWQMPAPGQVRQIDTAWIPLADGTRLAARLWLPESAGSKPVGAVLEYIPYRTRDLTRTADDQWGQSLATHGFAFIRVDLRGSGDSTGIMRDEFEAIEWEDLVEVIGWLARQDWCNGSVGMRGHSWGGNACLMAAVRSPPALKAVIASCASGDRFRKDLHWIGGAPVQTSWPAMLKTVVALPPDPAVSGPQWRERWLDRLSAAEPVAAKWLGHPRADSYWAQGSAAPHYDRVRCAVYAVSGLEDGYTNEVLDLLAQLKGPRRGMIGAWGHAWPHEGSPGPARVDWLEDELRWWTHWLHGVPTGIMDEPMLRVYATDEASYRAGGGPVAGSWIDEPTWPSRWVRERIQYLGASGMSPVAGAATTLAVPTGSIVGTAWPSPISLGGTKGLPGDQSDDDAHSLTFDGDPLDEPVTLVGRPRIRLRVCSDRPIALLAARLNAVSPDGVSQPISFGALNLAHIDPAAPAPLIPGQFYDVTLDLKFTARRIMKGSRLRLALSNSLWPILLPLAQAPQLAILSGASASLTLPIRATSSRDRLAASGAPRVSPNTPAAEPASIVHRKGTIEITNGFGPSSFKIEGVGTTAATQLEHVVTLDAVTPSSHREFARYRVDLSRGEWRTRTDAEITVQAEEKQLVVTEVTRAYEGDEMIFERRFVTPVRRLYW